VSLGSASVKPETFKGRKLKIVQASKQVTTRFLRDIKFPLSKHASNKRIVG
jgi:hypothetical protein